MALGLGVDHTVLQEHVSQTNVVDRQVAAGPRVIVSVVEFDQVFQQRMASPAQVEEVIDVLRLLILGLRTVLLLEDPDQTLQAG